MPTVLLVDDEPRIRDVVEYALERDGFRVLSANGGTRALEIMATTEVDLVVLDILMPDLDGLTVCREIRKKSSVPIIFLSSRTEEVDKILGLELGGDDYVTKPFSPRELSTRVKAVLRRTSGKREGDAETALTHGPVTLDLARHDVVVRGERLTLTVTEFAVLQALFEHPGHLLTRAQLIEQAYAHDNHITERTMDTHIRRIRAKLRPFGIDPIDTVHGLGYRARDLTAEQAAVPIDAGDYAAQQRRRE